MCEMPFSTIVFKTSVTFPASGSYYRTYNTFGQSGFIARVRMGRLCRVEGSVFATFFMGGDGARGVNLLAGGPRKPASFAYNSTK